MGIHQEIGQEREQGTAHLYQGDFTLAAAEGWPPPMAIISDGAYGVGGFPGDPRSNGKLIDWYAPHVELWSRHAGNSTTLWFWNIELGWATVHPLLVSHGWIYQSCNIWDKGLAFIAGNCNTRTTRRFPPVTEVCVQYVRRPMVTVNDTERELKEWLRAEWLRAGLPLQEANQACGVRNAATRKYLTQDMNWYMPPPEVFQTLVEYANEKGRPDGMPYYSIDGQSQARREQLTNGLERTILRAKFNGRYGITNVWRQNAVRGAERVKVDGKAIHANQKPLDLMERIILASTDPGDTVWEPFGGLCTAAAASVNTGRNCWSAEINPEVFRAARQRLEKIRESPQPDIQTAGTVRDNPKSGTPSHRQPRLF